MNTEKSNALLKLISEYKDIFHDDNKSLTFSNVNKDRIKTNDENPVYTRSYRYPYIHKSAVQQQVNKMLNENIIRHSHSPWNSPIWIVPKKRDASGIQQWRLVVDYRKLNEKRIDDKYPFSHIDDILDRLGRCLYFSVIDLGSGFHQIEIDPVDVEKTAFSVENGHYEFLRMPFGLKNAPSTFQRVMDLVLKGLNCCVVYLDDIIVYSVSLHTYH